MKVLLLVFVMFFSVSSFANHVELKINGDKYYCSKDPNDTGGNDDLKCEKELKSLRSKYDACMKSYSTNTCFSQVKDTILSKKAACPEAAELCNELCVAGYSTTTCYNICYN